MLVGAKFLIEESTKISIYDKISQEANESKMKEAIVVEGSLSSMKHQNQPCKELQFDYL